MLDAFIIDQLRKEREEGQWEPVPLELPLPSSQRPEFDEAGEEKGDVEDSSRGVVIITPGGQTVRV